MQLDVVVPTYNRAALLSKTLKSLFEAEIPPGRSVRVTVADNNSKDATESIVHEWMPRFDGRLSYVLEQRQGRSAALNAGICATSGDLVGFVDDDEQVDRRWYQVAFDAFASPEVEFIGGPCLPNWQAEPPKWLPLDKFRAVIGWVECGPSVEIFNENFNGMLTGGNAVIRRSTLHRVGLYSTDLGRTDKGLLSCEDQDMYDRLVRARCHGLYLPDLIIYHFIPRERMTKKYYRRWCFWQGTSMGVLHRKHPAPVADLFGVPRYMFGIAARGMLKRLKDPFASRRPAESLCSELNLWHLAGFIYGKHLFQASGTKTSI